MPTYEYLCNSCNHNFDVFQKMSDEPVAKCPRCGKQAQRSVTSFCASFKGTGFYVNDSVSKSSVPSNETACSGSTSE